MAEISVILTEVDIKALSYDCEDPQEWINHCLATTGYAAPSNILKKLEENKVKIAIDCLDPKVKEVTSSIDLNELKNKECFLKEIEKWNGAILDKVIKFASFKTLKEKGIIADNILKKG